jgi:TonB family protein
MRKMDLFCATISAAGMLLSGAPGIAQQVADAKTAALEAARSNGLADPNLQPWHIKVTFKLLDAKGNTEDQGSFEEYWASASKFKRTFTSAGFAQTEFGTADGIRRMGSRNSAPGFLPAIASEFVHPIALDVESIANISIDSHEFNAGTTKLSCLSAIRNSSINPPTTGFNETYCVSENAPILRIHLRGNSFRILRNNIVRFQGKYLPQDVEAFQMGAPQQPGTLLFTAHLESADALKTVDEAIFTPPADAFKPPPQITLTEEQVRGQLLDHPKPVYPAIAVAARVSGTVVLSVIIDTDGHVERAGALSGPPMLLQAAIDGVKRWTFRPFTDQGETAIVTTVLTLHFINPEMGGMIK